MHFVLSSFQEIGSLPNLVDLAAALFAKYFDADNGGGPFVETLLNASNDRRLGSL